MNQASQETISNHHAPYIRSSLSYSRMTNLIIVALLPCIVFALWNTGYQANTAIQVLNDSNTLDWRYDIIHFFWITHNPKNFWAYISYGALYFIPILIIAIIVTSFWQYLFATLRDRKTGEGFILLPLLFTLTLPATIPLWQVAIGLSFGIVIGKEIFGGLGMNIVNPVLAGRVFLYFSYPEQLSGTTVWTGIDGVTAATALSTAKSDGMQAFSAINLNWEQAFVGEMLGSFGETSALACAVAALFLIYYGVISARIVMGILAGSLITAVLFNSIGSETNLLFALPWYWHWVLGGFAFGTIFLATDPVTASQTNIGRWLYGLLIGVLIILIRVLNPTTPESITFAILLANILAPLIDHVVIQTNIKHRKRFLTQART